MLYNRSDQSDQQLLEERQPPTIWSSQECNYEGTDGTGIADSGNVRICGSNKPNPKIQKYKRHHDCHGCICNKISNKILAKQRLHEYQTIRNSDAKEKQWHIQVAIDFKKNHRLELESGVR